MNFDEALKKLGIEDYSDRIFNSNSQGELLHLVDYCSIAECVTDKEMFRDWFEETIKLAEQQWKRPESVFQHIPRLLQEGLTEVSNKCVD